MGSGRKRIEFKKVEKLQNRRVTFTKRRQGLIKKAEQLSSLTGCRVSALFFSPSCLNPILYGDLSLLEQAAAAAADADSSVAAIHRHSTTTTPASLFADCFQEQSPSAVGDNLVDQESLLLLTTGAALEDDQEERCRRQELLHQMDHCKPLQMIVPAIIENNNYHSASSSYYYYYSNIQKNNNYGAEDQMKMVTREVGSSSRINTTTTSNTNLVQSDQSLLLTACEEDQEEEWRRKELLQMDDHSGCKIQNNYNCDDYRYSYSSPFQKNNYGAGASRDMGMVTWKEVGSSSRNTTNINNNANSGLMNEEEAHQQQQLDLALSLAGDDLDDSLCMAGEGGDLNQLKQRFEAVRQSLLDKLMMAEAALSILS